MSSSLDIQDLLREGRAAALAGDTSTARARFRRATELDPASVEAWLGLSSAVPMLAEKREYLQRVLALDPDNGDARASLRYVEELLAEGRQLAPSQRAARPEPSADPAEAPAASPAAPAADSAPMYCYNHPDVETGLLCVQCNRPICGRCARPAAVGQLCPECRRARRPVNYKVAPRDLVVAGLVTLVLGALAGAVLGRFGFGGLFFGLILGALSGEGLVRVLDRATRGKRGLPMQITVGAALALGVLAGAILPSALLLLSLLSSHPEAQAALAESGSSVLGVLLTAAFNPGALLYLIAAIGTASVRLR